MKNIVATCILVIGGFLSHAQTANSVPHEPAPPPPGAEQWGQLVDQDWKSMSKMAGADWEAPGIKGSMFSSDDWQNGYLVIANRGTFKNIPLRFNIYSNEIYFKKDSQVLVIDSTFPAMEFGMEIKDEPGRKPDVFKCGYPAVGRLNAKTFFQVIANGKISLVKHFEKKIADRLNPLTGPEKIFIDSETWFVYDAGLNRMKEIRQNKNSFLAAFPEYSTQVQSILKEKGLKLRSDGDWNILFTELNLQVYPAQ